MVVVAVNPDMMRQLARELVYGDGGRRRMVLMAVDMDTDPCGCASVQVTHAGMLTDPDDADVARTLLRREYDRRAGRPNCYLELELDLSRGCDPS